MATRRRLPPGATTVSPLSWTSAWAGVVDKAEMTTERVDELAVLLTYYESITWKIL